MRTIKFNSVANPIFGSRFSRWALATVAMFLLGTIDGRSQGVVYTDRSIFSASLRPFPIGPTTITFTGLTDPSPTGSSPIVVSGVTFTNAESRLFTQASPIPGDGQYLWNFDSSYPVGIYLPNGRNAFGADFSGGIVQNNPFNATLTFTLVSGQTFTHNFTGQMGTWTFRGFVFPEAITRVIYDDGGPFLPGAHEEMLDNVTFGTAFVPEPSSIAIALAGALICRISRRCRS